LSISEKHLNPHKVVHGAVVYALADTGMGAALYPTLAADEICATIEIKINYYKPVFSGVLTCITKVVNRGKTIANIESSIYSGEDLIAKANGNYSIFRSRNFGMQKENKNANFSSVAEAGAKDNRRCFTNFETNTNSEASGDSKIILEEHDNQEKIAKMLGRICSGKLGIDEKEIIADVELSDKEDM